MTQLKEASGDASKHLIWEKRARDQELKPLTPYTPRPYQLPILKALDSGYKRVLAILPRRSGKDITALNYMIRRMYEEPGVYYYIFPTYSQAKKVIWDSITMEGTRVLDYFPDVLTIAMNSQEMKIRVRTRCGSESLFQLVGSDRYDTLMGTNPRGCVFSEYALQDPLAFQYLSPILTANGGWALFLSTPRGKNHLYDLRELARKSPDWFLMHINVEDTKHIPMEEIERERREGIMSEDMIQQEYYCSFARGVEGSYYGKYIDTARLEGRIGCVPWQSSLQVHTAWDIGVRDSTCIIFFQMVNQNVHIIDYFEGSKEGLETYVNLIKSKPYTYGKHIAPHDIKVKEWGSGITRIEKAALLGVSFEVADQYSQIDGIEAGRSLFSRLYIDEDKCAPLLNALENYRQEFDIKKRIYKAKPLHNWASHAADCYRYLAVSLPKTRDGLTALELDKRFNRVRMGAHGNLPPPFNIQNPNRL